jgi:uridylate kinase
MQQEKRIIISLGGSLLVPGAIDTAFVARFKDFIVSYIGKGYSFILVTGGGRTARTYIDAAAQTTEITDDDKDWLGIHATRLNGHFMRTVFREYAHPRINTNPHDLEDFYNAPEPILVAAGWRPGRSTDFCAVLLGKYLDVKRVINLSNVDCAYDRDPRQFPDAKKIERATWKEFRKVVGNVWSPGMSAPFDPIASKMAEEEDMEVAIMNGSDLDNLGRYLDGESFQGTVVRG